MLIRMKERKIKMGININAKFNIGDFVYVITDKDQEIRIITGITIRENAIQYGVSLNASESWFYGFELSKDKSIISMF